MSGALLIVEGVTGAGKSQLIKHIRESHAARDGLPVFVVDEDITLGTFLTDVLDTAWRKQPHFGGLEAGLAAADELRRAHPNALVILERFHLTAYALLERWDPLVPFDRLLGQRGARQILLDYHPRLTETRSILRQDRPEWGAAMDAEYGTRKKALATVRQSQEKRRRALALSRLPFLHLDTSEGKWSDFANIAIAFSQL